VNIMRGIAVLKLFDLLEAVRLAGSVRSFDVREAGVVRNLQVVAALNVVEVVDIDDVFYLIKDTRVLSFLMSLQL
jgi:hypothetical protein